MSGLFQKLACWLNFHPRIDIIQSFGSAQHVGCPYCRREFGIHRGMGAVIPWDSELAEMYDFLGYETEAATQSWRRVKP